MIYSRAPWRVKRLKTGNFALIADDMEPHHAEGNIALMEAAPVMFEVLQMLNELLEESRLSLDAIKNIVESTGKHAQRSSAE